MWLCYLCDTMTGELGAQIDVPAFSWSLSVSDCSFDTTADKGTGEGEASSLTVPWQCLPGSTPEDRGEAVATGKRGVVLCWEQDDEVYPVLFGAIGERTDTYWDTSFSLDSVKALLDDRYAVDEGVFGADTTTIEGEDGDEVIEGTTTACLSYTGMSLRGIASEVGYLCTFGKPGGDLPIWWRYRGESGSHERTYYGYNVSNLSCSTIMEELADVSGGPDMMFRPVFRTADPYDETEVYDQERLWLEFTAGSDDDPYIEQSSDWYISQYNDLSVAHAAPSMRVYETGDGYDEERICALAEDLSLCEGSDPVPLSEITNNDSEDDSLAEVVSAAEAELEAAAVPLCQVSLEVSAYDIRLGQMWPGDLCRVPIDDFPTLPDDVYEMRIMEMSGDETDRVEITFDVMEDPAYG